MAALVIKSFGGISPKVPPRYLQDTQAQIAINCPVFNGPLQPLQDVGASLLTLPKTGIPKTIYRFGQDVDSDTQYWFSWTTDVDVCRGQIAGDTSEWTFYTGDGIPRATYNAIALSGSAYPFVSRPLGLPNPASAPAVSLGPYAPEAFGAEVFISATNIENIDTTYGIDYSLDNGAVFTNVAITTKTAAAVAAALDAEASISAVAEGSGVRVTTTAVGSAANLTVRIQTGTTADTSSAFTYSGYDSGSVTGTTDTLAQIVITDTEIGSISAGDVIHIVNAGPNDGYTLRASITATGTYTAATLASALTAAMSPAGAMTVVAYGSCVVIRPGTMDTTVGDRIRYIRYTTYSGLGTTPVFSADSLNMDTAGPAQVILTQANIDSLEDAYLSTLVAGGLETINFVYDPATASNIQYLTGPNTSVEIYGNVSPIAIVKSVATGTGATLRLRKGTYGTVSNYITLTGVGTTEEPSATESRLYVYTYVNKESGFEFESGPSVPSTIVDVHDGQEVFLSNFEAIPSPYVATHKRIYRAVSGVYLFVTEITYAQNSFTDALKPDELGEELPTTTWLPPPANLSGLINLPNGLMAGFVGRDVYMCEPYKPHAWPLQYVNTVDYPVVGLGRMDTTLAVLTTGTPYFIQGADPNSVVVVKSDLEQACASKRSIVSANGVVIYASPDGLVMLTPGGSKLITETYFTRAQWQALAPESIHAYQHDRKYVAFYNTGATSGGFIYDLTSGQFILHDIYAQAGYTDLQRDQLFLAFSDRSLKKWLDGSVKNYVWRSKKFTLPEIAGFSSAQLEAETYPVTLKFYMDNSTTPYYTVSVTSRDIFRLPVKQGRDFEVQVEGNSEVFSLAIAQSVEELTNA